MKHLEIKTFFDTCYLGENRINNRYSFVEGVSKCVASCPDNTVYLDFDETIVSRAELESVFKDMEFPIIESTLK